MTFLLGLVGFLLTIGIIVIVHEGGHFFTAKFFNIKVTRFSFGMGPVLWRKRRGETEYCLSALPLGGYVQMAEETDGDLKEEDRARLYSRQARWKRALVLFAGPATNLRARLLPLRDGGRDRHARLRGRDGHAARQDAGGR